MSINHPSPATPNAASRRRVLVLFVNSVVAAISGEAEMPPFGRKRSPVELEAIAEYLAARKELHDIPN